MTPSSFEERFDELFGTPADIMGTMTFKSMDMVHKVKTIEATKQFGDAVKAFIKSELDKQRVEDNKRWVEKLKRFSIPSIPISSMEYPPAWWMTSFGLAIKEDFMRRFSKLIEE